MSDKNLTTPRPSQLDRAASERPDIGKRAFVVMVLGYWGAGLTVEAAAKKCLDAGASRRDKASLRLILGDDKPEVDSNGFLLRDQGSESIYMGMGFKLGDLAKLT